MADTIKKVLEIGNSPFRCGDFPKIRREVTIDLKTGRVIDVKDLGFSTPKK